MTTSTKFIIGFVLILSIISCNKIILPFPEASPMENITHRDSEPLPLESFWSTYINTNALPVYFLFFVQVVWSVFLAMASRNATAALDNAKPRSGSKFRFCSLIRRFKCYAIFILLVTLVLSWTQLYMNHDGITTQRCERQLTTTEFRDSLKTLRKFQVIAFKNKADNMSQRLFDILESSPKDITPLVAFIREEMKSSEQFSLFNKVTSPSPRFRWLNEWVLHWQSQAPPSSPRSSESIVDKAIRIALMKTYSDTLKKNDLKPGQTIFFSDRQMITKVLAKQIRNYNFQQELDKVDEQMWTAYEELVKKE